MGVPSIRVSSVRRLDIHEFLIAPDEPGRAVLIPLVATGSVEEGEDAFVAADHKIHSPGGSGAKELEALSRIIDALNERFGLNLGPEHRVTIEHIRSALDQDAGLDVSARVNRRENVRLTFDPKVEDKIQDIVNTNFELYKRITDDADFGQALKDFLFDDYMERHRGAEELLKLQESKTLEFKSSLRWNLKEDCKDDKHVTQAALKTIAAFLNTEGGDLLIGVDDDRKVLGIEHDRLENDDKFMRHLVQAVRNGLGDRAGTCIDPKTQIVKGKTVCLVSCQQSSEPTYLRSSSPPHPDHQYGLLW